MLNPKVLSRQALRKQKRDQQKEIEQQKNIENESFMQAYSIIKKLLSKEIIDKIAFKTKVIKRNKKLSPYVLFCILWIGCLTESHADSILSLERMCMFIKNWFDIEIKPQSLQEKINTENTAEFIKEIMAEVMKAQLNKKLQKILKLKKPKLIFNRILIEDSTVVSLPASMKRIFKGCGGAASEAAVKFNFVIDQNSQHIVQMKLVGGSTPDASLSRHILQNIEEEDIVIRDLGYFNLSVLSAITSMKNSYYLSRLSKTAYVYLSKDSETPIDLIDYLEKKEINNEGIDIELFIGKTEKLSVRLIAIKVPDEVKEARRIRYKAKNKKEPADDLLEWNGYTLMITNIPKEKLSLKSLLKIYRARWKIELFFKNMKSHICLDRLTGHNKYRIRCLIYIKAAITLVVTMLYSYAQLINPTDKEISLVKFTKWLKDEDRLMRAFTISEYTTLLEGLESNIKYLCMQNRTKGKSVWKEAREVLLHEEDIIKSA